MRTAIVATALVAAWGVAGCAPAQPPAPESVGPDPWAAARARGVDYRALGQEPGWYLEIDHGAALRLVYDYGERELNAAAPMPATSGTRTIYEIATPERLVVTIERRPCSDIMSGLPFPDTVTVTLAGRELRGCGQRL